MYRFSFALLMCIGGVVLMASIIIEDQNKKLAEFERLACITIEETRTVKMMGHLHFDQCYVVTTDPDENTKLHTIQCVDTLKFTAR